MFSKMKERFAGRFPSGRFLGSLGMTMRTGLLMLGVGVCSITLAVTSVGVGFGIQNARAAIVDNIADDTQSLFRTNGEHNASLAAQLFALADAMKNLSKNVGYYLWRRCYFDR